jgi:cytoplasmic iron level regulating protein YaaA (DUF328/UPF0246 family)
MKTHRTSLYHCLLSNGKKKSLSATSFNLAELLFQRQLSPNEKIVFINEHLPAESISWQPSEN